jgi:competence protein ComEC
MRLVIVFFALGVWWLQREPRLPEVQWAWTLLAIVPALALARTRHVALRRSAALSMAADSNCRRLPVGSVARRPAPCRCAAGIVEGRDIEVIGVVASLPQTTERSLRFELDVEQVLTAGSDRSPAGWTLVVGTPRRGAASPCR